jgi:hypothetical protein
MKRTIQNLIVIVFCVGLSINIHAQTRTNDSLISSSDEKSNSKKLIGLAYKAAVIDIMYRSFHEQKPLDAEKELIKLMEPQLIVFVSNEVINGYGTKMEENAENGKHQKHRLRYEKFEDKTATVPRSIIRKYSRLVSQVKKEWFPKRKTLTPKQILSQPSLAPKLAKLEKALQKKLRKDLRKSKG